MAKVLVVTSGKGGVGKTTSTASLGAALAQGGQRVVVIDFDVGLRNLDLVMGAERRVVFDLLGEQPRLGDAEHQGGFEKAWLDAADGEGGIDKDRVEGAESDQEEGRFWADAEQDHRQRQPGGDRHRAEQLKGWLQQFPHDAQAADQHAQRQRKQRRQNERTVDPAG